MPGILLPSGAVIGRLMHSRRLRAWAALVIGTLILLGVDALHPHYRLFPDFAAKFGAGTMLAIFIAALLCEYIDSSLGMGYGTMLTPALLLAGFDPLQIVPCVLFSEFATGLTAALMHQRDGNVDLLRDAQARSAALQLSLLSVFGTVAAVFLALSVPGPWLRTMIGLIVLSAGATTLLTAGRRLRYRRGHMVALGCLAAFNKGISGGGYGPLVTSGQVISGLSPKKAVAITSLAESLTCAVGLAAYAACKGEIEWMLAAPLTLGALLSVPAATHTVRRLSERTMRTSVGLATCLLGLITLTNILW